MEYFTANYLVRISRTPEELKNILLPRVAKREWDIVAQLAFQIQDKKTEGAGDELLTALIEYSSKSEAEERWNIVSFATRCLEFIVPAPKVRRNITTAVVELYSNIKLHQESLKQVSREFIVENTGDVFENLMSSGTENIKVIAERLEVLLIEQINMGDESSACSALELTLIGLTNVVESNCLTDISWMKVFERITKICSTRIKILLEKYLSLCIVGFYQGIVSFADFIKWHGLTGIFQSYYYPLFGFGLISTAESILIDTTAMIPYSGKQSEQNIIYDLKELGYTSLSSKLPLVTDPYFSSVDLIHIGSLLLNKAEKNWNLMLMPFLEPLY